MVVIVTVINSVVSLVVYPCGEIGSIVVWYHGAKLWIVKLCLPLLCELLCVTALFQVFGPIEKGSIVNTHNIRSCHVSCGIMVQSCRL